MQLLLARLADALYSERGQTLAEYGLILALVAVGVVVPTMFIFQAAITDILQRATGCLQDLPGVCVMP